MFKKIPKEYFPLTTVKDPYKQKEYDKERVIYGFDERELWNLPLTSALWLHQQIKSYIELNKEYLYGENAPEYDIEVLQKDYENNSYLYEELVTTRKYPEMKKVYSEIKFETKKVVCTLGISLEYILEYLEFYLIKNYPRDIKIAVLGYAFESIDFMENKESELTLRVNQWIYNHLKRFKELNKEDLTLYFYKVKTLNNSEELDYFIEDVDVYKEDEYIYSYEEIKFNLQEKLYSLEEIIKYILSLKNIKSSDHKINLLVASHINKLYGQIVGDLLFF